MIHRMPLFTLVTAALALVACSSPPTLPGHAGDSSGVGGSADGTSAGAGGGGGPTQTLVADWILNLPTGSDEIQMISSSAGTAQLYWYDSGEARWIVSADDDGQGNATLTLDCTSSDCGTADPIVFDCTYTYVALDCTGVSGGYQDNYAGVTLNLTKAGA